MPRTPSWLFGIRGPDIIGSTYAKEISSLLSGDTTPCSPLFGLLLLLVQNASFVYRITSHRKSCRGRTSVVDDRRDELH